MLQTIFCLVVSGTETISKNIGALACSSGKQAKGANKGVGANPQPARRPFACVREAKPRGHWLDVLQDFTQGGLLSVAIDYPCRTDDWLLGRSVRNTLASRKRSCLTATVVG